MPTMPGGDAREHPQRADRRRDRERLAALHVDPEREGRSHVHRVRRELEREQAEGGEDDSPDAGRPSRAARSAMLSSWATCSGKVGLAAVMPRFPRAPVRRVPAGVDGGAPAEAGGASGAFLRSVRQIARMRPGAATNMITSAWMKNSRSSGMPVFTCISPPPVRSAPNRSAAATMPDGRLPARRASAMALKP